jgi:hypothetical protein
MSKLKWMWFVAIPLAIGACTLQHQMLKQPSAWDLACADVAERYEVSTCDYRAPEVVRNSYIISEVIGAYGVFVSIEWRIYLAPIEFILLGDLTEEIVEYHESIHAVLTGDGITDQRCTSERIAREMTDKRYGTDSATNGWEVVYGCVDPMSLV